MNSAWFPEVNDAARTLIAGVQAATPWLHPGAEADGDESAETFVVPGASTAVPCEAGPTVAYGRDEMVSGLYSALGGRQRGGTKILVGAGGMGKSTIARLTAARIRRRDSQRRVWWISAANEEYLSGGLVSFARELGASTADQEMIRSHTVAGLGDVADRVWRLLHRARPGWLLVIDNADDPSLFGPSDGTGWIRRSSRGLLLVTTRDSTESCWPGSAEFIRVDPLSVDASASVLRGLAPAAGSSQAARALAKRLGCLPLALRIAGVYLRSDFTAWRTFDEYRRALDSEGVARVIDASQKADRRTVVTQTWELSVDSLVGSGLPQARPLLWLLSCYAPGSRIPEDVITGLGRASREKSRPAQGRHPLAALVDPGHALSTDEVTQRCLDGLRGLASTGLIQRTDRSGTSGQIDLHPFIAEVTAAVRTAGSQDAVNPSVVCDSAVAAICAAVRRLDVGRADDWRYFQDLAPHMQHLLSDIVGGLGPRQRHDLLDAATSCASSYMWSRAEQRAEQLTSDALELAEQLGCTGTAAYLRLQHVRGWSIREQDRYAEAADILDRVLRAQLRLPGGMTRPDALHTRHDLAWTIGRQGQWGTAEHELREVLRLRRERLHRTSGDHDDADILHTRCMLCWCIGKQGRWTIAERDYRQLAADRAAILGPNHPDTLDTHESLGKTLAWQGKWTAAEAEFHRLAARREAELGEKHPDTLLARQLAAYAAGYQAYRDGNRRKVRGAISVLEQILHEQRFARGDDHRNTKDTRATLAALQDRYPPIGAWTEDLPRPDPFPSISRK